MTNDKDMQKGSTAYLAPSPVLRAVSWAFGILFLLCGVIAFIYADFFFAIGCVIFAVITFIVGDEISKGRTVSLD